MKVPVNSSNILCAWRLSNRGERGVGSAFPGEKDTPALSRGNQDRLKHDFQP